MSVRASTSSWRTLPTRTTPREPSQRRSIDSAAWTWWSTTRRPAILPLAQAGARQITDIFAANVLGPSLLATAALDALKTSKGSIVNISSTYGHKAATMLSHYAAWCGARLSHARLGARAERPGSVGAMALVGT
jgi:NAD(P)-dependent dehydrogenase (short-subunit alcohol dehydrogenase family)